MGQSTDGILVYGIDFGEDFDSERFVDADGDQDFEGFIHLERGVSPIMDVESTTYRDARWNAQKEAVKNYPIELVKYCSGNYPMYVVAVPGTKIRASRGDAKIITPDRLRVTNEQETALKGWCEQHDIKWSQPHWLLCSVWD